MSSFYDRPEAANYLNAKGVAASRSSLARMAMSGEGPQYVIIRRRAYYRTEWLDAWLEQSEPSASALVHMRKKGGSYAD